MMSSSSTPAMSAAHYALIFGNSYLVSGDKFYRAALSSFKIAAEQPDTALAALNGILKCRSILKLSELRGYCEKIIALDKNNIPAKLILLELYWHHQASCVKNQRYAESKVFQYASEIIDQESLNITARLYRIRCCLYRRGSPIKNPQTIRKTITNDLDVILRQNETHRDALMLLIDFATRGDALSMAMKYSQLFFANRPVSYDEKACSIFKSFIKLYLNYFHNRNGTLALINEACQYNDYILNLNPDDEEALLLRARLQEQISTPSVEVHPATIPSQPVATTVIVAPASLSATMPTTESSEEKTPNSSNRSNSVSDVIGLPQLAIPLDTKNQRIILLLEEAHALQALSDHYDVEIAAKERYLKQLLSKRKASTAIPDNEHKNEAPSAAHHERPKPF